MSNLLEEYERLKEEMALSYGPDTEKAVNFIVNKFEAAENEAVSDAQFASEYFVNLFAKDGLLVFSPMLEQLLLDAGFKQELLLKRGQLALCWLLKEK